MAFAAIDFKQFKRNSRYEIVKRALKTGQV